MDITSSWSIFNEQLYQRVFLLAIFLIVRDNVVLTDSCSRANGFPVNVDIADNSGIAGYPE